MFGICSYLKLLPDGPLHISIRRCLSSTATFCQ